MLMLPVHRPHSEEALDCDRKIQSGQEICALNVIPPLHFFPSSCILSCFTGMRKFQNQAEWVQKKRKYSKITTSNGIIIRF